MMIRQIIPHPNYDESLERNDFLLLQLDEPATNVAPVVMNTNFNEPPPGANLTVIGLGSTQLTGPATDILREVVVESVANETCNEFYGDRVDQNVQLCAGLIGRDACSGDSGGPLTNEDGVLLGVVSWGWFCALYPGVYSRVSSAQDWIRTTICDFTRTARPSNCDNPPQPDPFAGKLPVYIQLHLDQFPHEVSFSVERADTGQIQLAYPDFPFLSLSPLTIVQDRVYLDAGFTYALKFVDFAGDGFCCMFGSGRFRVFTTIDGVELTLAEDRATFQTERTVPFEIPTLSPLPALTQQPVADMPIEQQPTLSRKSSYFRSGKLPATLPPN